MVRTTSDPLVLVAMSSIYQHQVDLLGRMARALGRLPVRGVLTTGRAIGSSLSSGSIPWG
jgi:UDP:flavonoid glycosyltransferase YjiC (YdhE family)